jgi:hypothetical protein
MCAEVYVQSPGSPTGSPQAKRRCEHSPIPLKVFDSDHAISLRKRSGILLKIRGE